MDIFLGIIGYWLLPAIATSLVLVKLVAVDHGHTFHQELSDEDNFPVLILGTVWPFGLLIAAFIAMMVISERSRKTQ